MTISSNLISGFSTILGEGQQIRIKYYNVGYGAGSYYDDDVIFSQSGTDFWTSGIVLPISNKRGSSESVLVEQGKLLTNDTKLYLTGTINTSGTVKFGLGSPITNEYSLLSEGVKKWTTSETPVMKKLYLRILTNGSFIGEA